MKKYLYTITFVLSIVSCEKVIELPLNEADQKIVIEAPLSNLDSNYILISKTGSVYENSIFDKVSGAIVTVTDKNNTVYTFQESIIGSGKYVDTTFRVEENNIYKLKVIAEGQTFTSECITQTLTPLNYIFPITVETPLSTPENPDSVKLMFFSFTDNASETNYYRFKVYKNGKYTKELYLGDDKLINGEVFEQPFYGDTFDSGDSVLVQMLNIDKANYAYFYSLANTQSDSPFSATPANPVTNINGGALGYFGSYLIDEKFVVVP
ncbi:MAG TPA: DUF4249 domain-containing protein [Crocinitomix sp.]|nr:DUF4249 domain-containing protein [Crocinitomix sp.]